MWLFPVLVVAMWDSKKEEQNERDQNRENHCGPSERPVAITPRRNMVSQILPSQSTKGDGCCKSQLPSYRNCASHKPEMGFSAISPAFRTHWQLPPCWVFHVPPSRETSVTRHLKWDVATLGYILNHDRLCLMTWCLQRSLLLHLLLFGFPCSPSTS